MIESLLDDGWYVICEGNRLIDSIKDREEAVEIAGDKFEIKMPYINGRMQSRIHTEVDF